MKCDHIVGESVGVDESWLTRWSESGKDKDYLETMFKFCPECGSSLKGIRLKRRPPYKPDDVSPAMQALGKECMKKMIEHYKRPSLLHSLKAVDGKIGTVVTTFERSFTAPEK